MDNNSKTLSLKKTSPYIDTFRITKGVKYTLKLILDFLKPKDIYHNATLE